MKRLSWIFLLTILASLSLASGPGNDDGAPSASTDGEFHAWLKHPEHVFEANLMQLRIRLFPETNRFPGMKKADVNRFDDTVVQATIAVAAEARHHDDSDRLLESSDRDHHDGTLQQTSADISVPLWNAQIANRPQSHIQREKARGREALEFCRRAILNASGLIVVAPRYEDSDRMVHCRVELLDEAGDRVDLGTLLVKNGFASRAVVDWGRRRPE